MKNAKKYAVVACLAGIGLLAGEIQARGIGPGPAQMYQEAGNYRNDAGSGSQAAYRGGPGVYAPGSRGQQATFRNGSYGYGYGRDGQQSCLNQNGNIYGPGYRSGGGNATGPVYGPTLAQDICESEVVTVSGVVVEATLYGQGGVVVSSDSGLVTVYGIGPFRYWDELGIARPGVSEEVEITAYNVIFSDGSERLMADTVWINGEEPVDLRDEYCLPSWRRGPRW